MTVFFPDIVEPNDPAGFGFWLVGHDLEHQQFNVKAAALAHPRFLQSYNLVDWDPEDKDRQKIWLETHMLVHYSLRDLTGVSGYNLAAVDLGNPTEFQGWVEDHAQEHAQLRQVFGLP